MADTAGISDAVDLTKSYQAHDANLRVRQTMVISVCALVLVPAWIVLDYFVYPEYIWPIIKVRLLCDALVLPLFLLLFTRLGKRHIKVLCHLPPALPAMAIAWMIYLTEGIRSPYYAGMNIVMVAVVLLIPFALAEASIFCSFVIICYASACWLHVAHPPHQEQINGGLSSGRTLTSNLYFLGGTMVLSLTASHFASIRRFVDFRLRHELDTNNRELASTLNKLKETEVQLVQSEKMNALGKLSAGLLHEVNNPLNFMFMAMQVAEQEVGDNASLRDTLKDIGEGMGRIRTVISDLRAFAHPTHELAMQQFSLDDALTSALRLTAHELGTIPVDRQGIRGISAMGASTQIVHVFMNLLINSAHAVKHKVASNTAQIKVYATESNGRLQVAVRDNGTGVAPENLPKLLDPFFTTKSPGEGMGLGLSICHTIVKNHGGAMIVTSELGAWTEVKFDLPLDRASVKPAEPEAQPAAEQVRSAA